MLTKGAPSASDRGLLGVVDRNDSMFIEGARFVIKAPVAGRPVSINALKRHAA
jgi:hypothetical protein